MTARRRPFLPAMAPCLALLIILLAGAGTRVEAHCWVIPSEWLSWAGPSDPTPVSIWILPDGTGLPLDQAQGLGGGTVSLSIQVQLVDSTGSPVTTVEPDEVWIEDLLGEVSFCLPGWHPDVWNQAAGEFFFTQPPAGGGSRPHDNNNPFLVKACNVPLYDTVLNLAVNSPDINGDLVVDLVDLSLFGQDFFRQDFHGVYAYRSDFVWDGTVDLLDLAVFGSAMGIQCE